MDKITINLSNIEKEANDNSKLTKVKNFINAIINDSIEKKVINAKKVLLSKTGEGNDFLGWIDLPLDYDKEEFDRIKVAADKIRKDSQALVVIGIGGSYLGARAVDHFLRSPFNNDGVEIYYVGNNLSSDYMNDVIKALDGKDFSINVISKSGTTTEPAVAFRIFKKLLEEKYGTEGAKSRIYATTDKEKGALKTLADTQGYETFVVPSNIGGRFSVLSAVGLLPIAAMGIDIDMLMKGAQDMRSMCIDNEFSENDALLYAAIRYKYYTGGKTVEILASFEPYFHYVSEWWKQLYGESEGKQGKGLFPASVELTTDLHSLGQYIQEGKRCMIETILELEGVQNDIVMKEEADNSDELNYLAGKNVSFVNDCACKGTIKAHNDGDVPIIRIQVPQRNEYYLGQLFYFFEFACGISGYMLGVNPFNQPGVEAYKKNMFELLGKPGYERSEQ